MVDVLEPEDLASILSRLDALESAQPPAIDQPFVDARQFLVNDGGASDQTAALQAAIDFAWTSGKKVTQLPPWIIKTTAPIYFDPPGNLRAGAATMHGWTMRLVGATGGHGNGTTIRCAFDDAPGLIIGTGHGNTVENVMVSGTVDKRHPKLHSPENTGFAIAGGSSGSQRTTLKHCFARNFYTGYKTGYGDLRMSERNLLIDCASEMCYIGAHFQGTDNVINTMISCATLGTRSVVAFSAAPVAIMNGQFGNIGARHCKATMASKTPLTHTGNYNADYTFTAVIENPDDNWRDLVYDSIVLKLPSLNLVPFTLEAFDETTNTATLKLWTPYARQFWFHGGLKLDDHTDFNNELAACTTIYAVERSVLFEGPCHVSDLHFEDGGNQVVTLMMANHDSRVSCSLVNAVAGHDITLSQYAANTNGHEAKFYAQQAFPFFHQHQGQMLIRDNTFRVSPGNRRASVVYDLNPAHGFICTNTDIYNPNIRGTHGRLEHDPCTSGFHSHAGVNKGAGEFDIGMFGPWSGAGSFGADERNRGTQSTSFQGWLPTPGNLPRLTTGDLDTLRHDYDGTPINRPALYQYAPVIDGQTLHSVSQPGPQKYALAKHAGINVTYGRDLNVNWSGKGQTFWLNVSGTEADWLFPGLHIILDFGGTLGKQSCCITETYPILGVVAVHGMSQSQMVEPLCPTKEATGGGAVIGQEKFRVQKFGRQCEFASQLSDLNGQTFSANDIVYNSQPQPGEVLGWICTTGGVVDGSAVFAAMPVIGPQI